MKFVIKKSKDKQFYFILQAKNNQVVMTSETYKSRRNAKESLMLIQNAFFKNHGMIDTIDKTK